MFTNPCSFVQSTFPPVIGCLSSQGVEQICHKNNLSFIDMLRPFCSLNVEHRIRDPSGSDHHIKNLQVCIQDVNDKPPLPTSAKRLLNEAVSNAPCETTKPVNINNMSLDIPSECKWFHLWSKTFLSVQYPSDHEFTTHLLGCLLVISATDPPETLQSMIRVVQQMPSATPSKLPKWFSPNIFKFYVVVHDVKDADRDKAIKFFNSIKTSYGQEQCVFLEINSQLQQAPSNVIHDYWINYVTSKSHESDGSEQGSSPRTPAEINNLGGMPNTVVNELDGVTRSGGSPEVAQEAGEVNQAVVLHPLSPDLESVSFNIGNENQMQANDIHRVVNSDVWTGLSSNCQHGAFLTPSDIGNIKNLIRHLVIHVLIPHVERQIFLLNDMVSNKKGVSRSLLSATKRLFSTSKTGASGATSLNSVIYASDAPELQLRRLGDLYFMFTNYSLAFQAYHSAKRDFQADQAYMHLAGALEMAALSAFMQGDTGRKALEYMEEAISIYLNSCKLPQFATRATLLSAQFLKDRQRFGEAAKQLIRMTSEESDLRSALLLEQASYCFLYSSRPNMHRKYAFHMVLAGHRFSKAGQRKHALRCYKQAFQVYQSKGWNLAEDHIHYTIGRLAGHLKMLQEGSESLSSLLSSGSKQTPVQQVTYLREYLKMLQQLCNEEPNEELKILPLPVIEDNNIHVLVSANPKANLLEAFEPDSPDDFAVWTKMEELALTESQGAPMIFKPTVYLFSKNTKNSVNPVVVVNETIYVQINVKNPLQITLPLLRIQLLWNFHTENGEIISNVAESDAAHSHISAAVTESIYLNPNSSRQVILTLTPLRPGQVDILGMRYVLTCPSESEEPSDVPAVEGKQLFVVRGSKMKVIKEQRTDVAYEKDNRLNVKVIEALPLLQVDTENWKSDMLCGEIGETRLRLRNSGNAPLKNLYLVSSTPNLFIMSNECVTAEKIVSDATSDGLRLDHEDSAKDRTYKLLKIHLGENDVMDANEDVTLPIWIRAPDGKGFTKADFLFYYESASDNCSPRYRITRFSQNLHVHDSLQLSATLSRSKLYEDKDTVTIALNVKNLNENSHSLGSVTINLVQISLATPKWELQKKVICSNDLMLNSQESYSCVLRASRSCDESVELTDVCLQEDSVPPGSVQPFYDFYKWHRYNDKSNTLDDNIYKMVVCLRWKGVIRHNNQVTNTFDGQSHVTLPDLGVASVWPAEAKVLPKPNEQVKTLKIFGLERRAKLGKKLSTSLRLENVLSYNLLYDQRIQHSFQEQRICRVEMKLILRNCIDLPLRVTINKPGTRQNVTSTQLYTPYSSSTFAWSGRCSSLLRVAANEKSTVVLAATFTAPGTYDLGSRLRVAAALLDDSDFTDQLCSVESSIIIFDREQPIVD